MIKYQAQMPFLSFSAGLRKQKYSAMAPSYIRKIGFTWSAHVMVLRQIRASTANPILFLQWKNYKHFSRRLVSTHERIMGNNTEWLQQTLLKSQLPGSMAKLPSRSHSKGSSLLLPRPLDNRSFWARRPFIIKLSISSLRSLTPLS